MIKEFNRNDVERNQLWNQEIMTKINKTDQTTNDRESN
jgi:hypothetical protein